MNQRMRWQKALQCPRSRDKSKRSICYPYLGPGVPNAVQADTAIDLCRRGTQDKLIINFQPIPLKLPCYLRIKIVISTY